MSSLTTTQALDLYIRNDARNVRDIGTFWGGNFDNYKAALEVIADCALHWFVAKHLGLVDAAADAEDNLFEALTTANRNVWETTERLRELGDGDK